MSDSRAEGLDWSSAARRAVVGAAVFASLILAMKAWSGGDSLRTLVVTWVGSFAINLAALTVYWHLPPR